MPSRRRQQFQSNFRHLLAVEALETRAMLAGNVTASVSNRALVIKGDAEANEIIISQTSSAAGHYTITPIEGSSTTINGGTVAVNLQNVTRVTISMAAGNDKVGFGNDLELVNEIFAAMAEIDEEEEEVETTLQATVVEEEESEEEEEEVSEEERDDSMILTLFGDDEEDGFEIEDPEFTPQQLAQLPTRVTGQTTVDLGEGDDSFLAMLRSNGNLIVTGGKGSDAILTLISSVSNLLIDADPARGTGMGSDIVGVVLSNVRGDLGITTEGGDDGVLVLGTKVTNFGMNAGGPATTELTDNDFVAVSNLYAADNVGVQTETGDDEIYVHDIVADNLRIYSGEGDDEVEVTEAALVSLLIDTAGGEDWVSLNSGEDGLGKNVIRRNLGINTGADDDSVEIEGGLLGLYVGGVMDLRTGAGDDELLLYNVAVGRTAMIEFDAGNDTAIIDSLDVRLELTLSMSAGNDVLSVHNLSANKYTVRGGTGNDTIHDLGNHEDELSQGQFEHEDDGPG